MMPILAIIVPVFNEQNGLLTAITRLTALLQRMICCGVVHDESYILFIDDGSTDNSWLILHKACKPLSMVRGMKLSKNYGHNLALLAGLMTVKDHSDISISIDCDMQQDPEAMFKFLEKYKAGADIVFGIRNDRSTDSLYKKYTALAFYKLTQLMGVKLHTNHADYRLVSNRVLHTLAEYKEPNIFLRAVFCDMGYPTNFVYFDVIDRAHGKSKWSTSKMFKFAVQGITSFSAFPLRMISILGLIVFGLSLLMAAYVVVQTVVVGGTVPGWASTVLPIYLLGGLQILCMGVVGEYIAQVYSAAKGRPRYVVERELF